MKAADWIDRLKASKGLPSDYKAAQVLGVSRQVVSTYRSKPVTMDEDMCIKLADAIGIPAEAVLVDQYAERSKSDSALSALQRLRQLFSVYYV